MSLEEDRERARASRVRFQEEAAREHVVVCTGHLPVPSAGIVDRWSGGFRFRPWEPGTGATD
jgi:hypothetical protein